MLSGWLHLSHSVTKQGNDCREGIREIVDGVVGDGDAPGDRACDEFKKREGKVGHDPGETDPSYDLLSC